MASGEEEEEEEGEVEGHDDETQSNELNADGIRQFVKPDWRQVVDEDCNRYVDQTRHDSKQLRYHTVYRA